MPLTSRNKLRQSLRLPTFYSVPKQTASLLLSSCLALSLMACSSKDDGEDPPITPPVQTPEQAETADPSAPGNTDNADTSTPATDTTVPARSAFSSINVLSAEETLRKAVLSLSGRLPTAKETQFVMNNIDNIDPVLNEVLKEEAFYTRLMEMYNDFLLTNKYLGGERAINLLKDDGGARAGDGFDAGGAFNNRKWYYTIYDATEKSDEDKATYNYNKLHSNDALAQEALRLLAHVVKNDLPYTEFLTADYTITNPYAARSYGAQPIEPWTDTTDPEEFKPVRITGYPHSGVLTSPMFLNRFPTTFTNRNRHRARIVYDFFLDIDILSIDGLRPNMADDIVKENAVVTNPNCAVCHDLVDPVASLFQNFTDDGRYVVPERGWFQDMQPRGFPGGDEFDLAYTYNSVQWLAQQVVQHDNFAPATIRVLYRGLTGQDTLKAHGGTSEAFRAEYERQQAEIKAIAEVFKADNYNLKTAIKALVKSPLYRASSVEVAEADTHTTTGAIRLLTPEMLNRKIDAVFNMEWRNYWRYDKRQDAELNTTSWIKPRLTSTSAFLQLYGGIDSDQIITRIQEPNGIMTSVQARMANEMACFAVPLDFFRETNNEKSKAHLFPHVFLNDFPLDNEGQENTESVTRIKQNIQHLHKLILGETVSLNGPELAATYNLFVNVWQQGNALMASEETSKNLPGRCQVLHHPDYPDFHDPNDESKLLGLDSEIKVYGDPRYVIRSWMAVVSYLTSDYRFVYE